MNKKERVYYTSNDGTIEQLQQYILTAITKGATHFEMYYNCDRNFASARLEFFKEYTDEELKNMQIKELEDKLNKLKGS
jgi:hypothetical protein